MDNSKPEIHWSFKGFIGFSIVFLGGTFVICMIGGTVFFRWNTFFSYLTALTGCVAGYAFALYRVKRAADNQSLVL